MTGENPDMVPKTRIQIVSVFSINNNCAVCLLIHFRILGMPDPEDACTTGF
jgi:hypothetical protein